VNGPPQDLHVIGLLLPASEYEIASGANPQGSLAFGSMTRDRYVTTFTSMRGTKDRGICCGVQLSFRILFASALLAARRATRYPVGDGSTDTDDDEQR
jgi:hypothetical protein